jgi:hypothetical protein
MVESIDFDQMGARPPRLLRAGLPFRYRYLLPLADPIVGPAVRSTLFRAQPPGGRGTVSSR